jgi:hypothetical protein
LGRFTLGPALIVMIFMLLLLSILRMFMLNPKESKKPSDNSGTRLNSEKLFNVGIERNLKFMQPTTV